MASSCTVADSSVTVLTMMSSSASRCLPSPFTSILSNMSATISSGSMSLFRVMSWTACRGRQHRTRGTFYWTLQMWVWKSESGLFVLISEWNDINQRLFKQSLMCLSIEDPSAQKWNKEKWLILFHVFFWTFQWHVSTSAFTFKPFSLTYYFLVPFHNFT